MRELQLSAFTCPKCRLPYSPDHGCICQLRTKAEEAMQRPGSWQRAAAILFALLLMTVTAFGLYAAVMQ